MLARNEMQQIPPGRIERWLGFEKAEHLRRSMRGWYGRPINLTDVPGSVWITRDGDFVGKFKHGGFGSALDNLEDYLKRVWRESARPSPVLAAGFASISDALNRASDGFSQRRPFTKTGSTGVLGISSSLWRSGVQPAAGTAPAAAPGGTAFTNATTGAVSYANPAAGSNRLVGSDVAASVIDHTLLMYDLIFGCNKTMNSTAAEAVTGVPTRYQSAVATAEDYAGDNFLFVQVGGTALAATAHNWASCTYTDQDGNAGAVLPTITGVSGAIVDRYDHTLGEWFAPLASGDNGIRNLTNMQCSAAVATGVVWFMMGHPLGFMSFPVIRSLLPFDWLTNRDQAPRVYNGACVAFLEPLKPATGACTYTGRVYVTATAS
jgi:hypothetical protein